MAPIRMSNAQKRRPSNKEPTYIPSTADEFPFGAPTSANHNVPSKDGQTHRPTMTAKTSEKRTTADKNCIDASSPKHQKTAGSSAEVTAYKSSARKRKVPGMIGSINNLSVKPSKALKHNHVYTKKREASNPVFTDRYSAKRPKTSPWSVDDDTGMEDAPSDIPESAEPKLGEETAAKTSPAKRDVPISLEALAREEEATKAAKADAKTLAQTASQTAVSQAEANDPSPVDFPVPTASATAAAPKKRTRKPKAKEPPVVKAAPAVEADTADAAPVVEAATADTAAADTAPAVDSAAEEVRTGQPAYNPGACFTHALPAALSPWPYDCLAPTPRLDQNLSVSPVNWDNVKGVTEPQVEAYEMRAPWNHKPTTFAEVAKQTEFKRNGEIPSEEGIRKRFKAASLAVFRISGVYFDTSCLGLDNFGVPNAKDLKQWIKDVGQPIVTPTAATTAGAATTSPDGQTTDSTAAPVQHASGAASTGTSDAWLLRRALRRARRRALRAAPRQGNRQDAMEHRPSTLFYGEIVTVQLHSSSPIPAYRNVDAKLVPKYRSLLREDVSTTYAARPVVLKYIPELPFRPAAFDRWLAAVCFGTRTAFPTQNFVCHGVDKGTYRLQEMARDREGETVDMVTVLETYILSTVLGTDAAASDMLFAELQSGVAAQSSGDEGPINARLYRRMQPYILKDPRLSDMGLQIEVADEPDDESEGDSTEGENAGSRPSLATFKDRPTTYQIPSFIDCFNDAPAPYYTTSTTEPGKECPDVNKPFAAEMEEFL